MKMSNKKMAMNEKFFLDKLSDMRFPNLCEVINSMGGKDDSRNGDKFSELIVDAFSQETFFNNFNKTKRLEILTKRKEIKEELESLFEFVLLLNSADEGDEDE